MRCDECRYWDLEAGKRECGGKIVGECTRAIPWWIASDWKVSDDDAERVLLDEYKDRRFFAQDGSDYKATVLTTGDFFCADFILHDALSK